MRVLQLIVQISALLMTLVIVALAVTKHDTGLGLVAAYNAGLQTMLLKPVLRRL